MTKQKTKTTKSKSTKPAKSTTAAEIRELRAQCQGIGIAIDKLDKSRDRIDKKVDRLVLEAEKEEATRLIGKYLIDHEEGAINRQIICPTFYDENLRLLRVVKVRSDGVKASVETRTYCHTFPYHLKSFKLTTREAFDELLNEAVGLAIKATDAIEITKSK